MSTPEYEPQPHGTPPSTPPVDQTQQISAPGYGSPGQQQPSHGQNGYGQPGPAGAAMPAPPSWAQYAQPNGALGTMRPTGTTILLFFVTLAIWGFVY